MGKHPSVFAVALAFALATCVVGCDDGGATENPDTASAGAERGAPSGAGERAVEKSIAAFYRDLAAGNARAACAAMSPGGRKRLASSGAGCDTEVRTLLRSAKRSGSFARIADVKVGDVDINGDKATAVVSFGSQDAQVPLHQIDGRWHLGAVLALPSGANDANR